jgi:hypothetical protein
VLKSLHSHGRRAARARVRSRAPRLSSAACPYQPGGSSSTGRYQRPLRQCSGMIPIGERLRCVSSGEPFDVLRFELVVAELGAGIDQLVAGVVKSDPDARRPGDLRFV